MTTTMKLYDEYINKERPSSVYLISGSQTNICFTHATPVGEAFMKAANDMDSPILHGVGMFGTMRMANHATSIDSNPDTYREHMS